MTDTKSEYRDQLLRTIQIQNDLLNDFDLFDPRTEEAIINLGIYWTERLKSEHFTLTQLKSITNDILTMWKEDMGGVLSVEDVSNAIIYAYNQPQNVCIREIVIAATKQLS